MKPATSRLLAVLLGVAVPVGLYICLGILAVATQPLGYWVQGGIYLVAATLAWGTAAIMFDALAVVGSVFLSGFLFVAEVVAVCYVVLLLIGNCDDPCVPSHWAQYAILGGLLVVAWIAIALWRRTQRPSPDAPDVAA